MDQSRLRSDFRIGAVDEAFQPSSGSVPDAVGVPVDPDIPFYGFDPGDFPVRSRNASRSGSPFPFDGKGAGRFIFGLLRQFSSDNQKKTERNEYFFLHFV